VSSPALFFAVRDATNRISVISRSGAEAVTVDELRDQFAHGHPCLENSERDRVKAIVKQAIRAERDGQDYQ